ncbi:unnamed protein product [Rhizophagus irregularis]|nr:unnamed protein product [Rhizophagus irregularis]
MTDAENLHHICDRISCGNGLSSFRPSDAREFWLLFRWPKNALKFDGFLDLLSGFRRIFQAGLNPLEYLDVYRLPVFGRVENSTSEHLTRKVRGNDLSSRYCTLSSERRFGFRSLVDACSDSKVKRVSEFNDKRRAAQSLVAAPLDSLKVRFEVNDLLEGKHKSMFVFAKTTWKELGVASIYRGIGLTLVKDSLSCGLFFGIFEFVKQQCYNA